MSFLPDDALDRLRGAISAPDLTGTRYRLVRELARGGMSTVFLVEDPALGRTVALKLLDLPDPDGGLARRLTAEARVLATLEHPGIAPVHEVGTLVDGRVYYTMRFVEGPRLDTYLATHAARSSASGALAERLRLFQRIVEAVAFAHAHGVLHRDLKPQNVMVGPFGEVLVMDWGLARTPETDDRSAAGHRLVLGTPGFMSPEQARGEHDTLDPRTDVYALGAMLFHLLAAQVPPPDRPLRAPTIPRPLLAICERALATDPAARYPEARQIHREIDRYLAGERVEAHHESLPERLTRHYRRHHVAFWLVLAYIAVRGTLLFFSGR